MMLKRRRKQPMGARVSDRVRSPSHLQWVRGHECCICMFGGATTDWLSNIEAHHVRVEGDGTTGKRPGDDKVVPLCGYHHELGHRIGWLSLEERFCVDLTAIAAALWKASPHRRKWERRNV